MTSLRNGIRRIDETLIAPGATPGERLLGYGAGAVGSAFAAVLAIDAGLASWLVVVLALLGFDLFGGAVVNATRSGSKRFHGPSATRWSGLGFAIFHVHPLLLALILPDEMPWLTAIVAYVGLLLATALIIGSSAQFHRPVAFLSASMLIAIVVAMLEPASVIGWVLPILSIKILLSHLLPHP